MAPSNIEKNATYLRRYLKNVYYFGYTADFNTKKSYKFGPSGSVDVVSFYYDIYESEPILWYSESNFLRRIFEVEKWARIRYRRIDSSMYTSIRTHHRNENGVFTLKQKGTQTKIYIVLT